MKKFLVLLLSAVLLFCLVGCQSNTKSEEKIKQDILSEDKSFESLSLHLTNFEITDRRTNSDNQTDVVYCAVNAENEEMQYTSLYSIKYCLYEQGWLIESFNKFEETYKPLSSSVTKEQASADMEKDGYWEAAKNEYVLATDQTDVLLNFVFEKDELDLESGEHTFYFVDNSANFQCVAYYRFAGNWHLSWVDFKLIPAE